VIISPKNIHLNPTGGYKSLAQFTVLVNMTKILPSRYIFKQPNQLLTLSPLPVSFDYSPSERYRRLIEFIESKTFMGMVNWEQEVQ
jgi:hypothetical protein